MGGTTPADPSERSEAQPIMDVKRCKYPISIVWTPIPLLTWLFPIIGHMGIAYTTGVIRDFAGPYYVSEDDMAFGKPTKYWVLSTEKVVGGGQAWDRAIYEASEEYKTRMHNLCCDNCHSHVAYALNLMRYEGSSSWNMVWLALGMVLHGRYVSFAGFIKTWLPFLIIVSIILIFTLVPF
ncbi:transmembrane protein 222 [Folsomia candida]|uniref:Protein REVERSION-TO-ETHYLENE SENSITIVITY1 n=1 Tax=Folsomia candida TaxID=158441 RepID=A0A226EKR4_FOLCA|nr:transmembrane protein 222 [Folsomia candida]XP_021949642.1 transmembrane protein 222 [Folsomia candida]XP_021949643.1 transmembrane protein 222 [Folsomia candida]XP_021949644.1 transmembrane protein 222 [Folsomia candida]OXA58295.1 Protein REVERSION-TO-ETHYLENE SENSITIVITY1 [Folsomia candida]